MVISDDDVQPDHAVSTALRRPGAVIALFGGLLVGLAYFALPVASAPMLGSITAPALLNLIADVASATSLSMLRIAPIAAAAIVGLGLWLLLSKHRGRSVVVGAVGIFGCAALTLLAYLVPIANLHSQIEHSAAADYGVDASSFAGAGLWLALAGAVIALAGAGVVVTGCRKQL